MVAPVAPNPYFIVAPSLHRHSHVSLSRHLAVRTTPLFDSPGCGTPHASRVLSHSLAFSYSGRYSSSSDFLAISSE
jgi:hypothetical protein